MELELARLRALAAAVDQGTFDAAAAALHVTPSAISQRIRALEKDAGRVLLIRSRPVVPTAAGESLLRLARQIDVLAADAALALDGPAASLPIAVNADSLSTWVLPTLAPLAAEIAFEFHRGDQSRTLEQLRAGTVVAAISSDDEPVQGCTVSRLGAMRYLPVAAASYCARWFPNGADAATLAHAPVLEFDEHDDLQRQVLERIAPGAAPPRHRVPGSVDFAAAARLGFGWGMVPEPQLTADLVPILADAAIDVPLYWHAWTLGTPALERTAAALLTAAAQSLR
ncbi:ArgP/LysG family DNA-binding transcriptional regulator [Gulosibacter macacae]|uniref:ArgP/LysG family DNA-binding transcriptional regulator n=1 Tax=Gulosibacter macacae TaxID=2488791 RepID=A0A3P3VXJ8_9MICO|nr:ArgP/LysG family DNA-binding transcriptional regulator [Gulosibacter macacae]RRJ87522.1 ArgP/LysG family DNA-binding transcriptional regulator [Gulosibacter macacae]